jgi:hypothetical protein
MFLPMPKCLNKNKTLFLTYLQYLINEKENEIFKFKFTYLN